MTALPELDTVCKNCKYYFVPERLVGSESAECRRAPKSRLTENGYSETRGLPPIVWRSYWCGEYKVSRGKQIEMLISKAEARASMRHIEYMIDAKKDKRDQAAESFAKHFGGAA